MQTLAHPGEKKDRLGTGWDQDLWLAHRATAVHDDVISD